LAQNPFFQKVNAIQQWQAQQMAPGYAAKAAYMDRVLNQQKEMEQMRLDAEKERLGMTIGNLSKMHEETLMGRPLDSDKIQLGLDTAGLNAEARLKKGAPGNAGLIGTGLEFASDPESVANTVANQRLQQMRKLSPEGEAGLMGGFASAIPSLLAGDIGSAAVQAGGAKNAAVAGSNRDVFPQVLASMQDLLRPQTAADRESQARLAQALAVSQAHSADINKEIASREKIAGQEEALKRDIFEQGKSPEGQARTLVNEMTAKGAPLGDILSAAKNLQTISPLLKGATDVSGIVAGLPEVERLNATYPGFKAAVSKPGAAPGTMVAEDNPEQIVKNLLNTYGHDRLVDMWGDIEPYLRRNVTGPEELLHPTNILGISSERIHGLMGKSDEADKLRAAIRERRGQPKESLMPRYPGIAYSPVGAPTLGQGYGWLSLLEQLGIRP
jgi:hypothetical protein